MPNTIQIKRSATPGSAPAAGNLTFGELALNYSDGILYYKNTSNVVSILATANTIPTRIQNGTSNVVVLPSGNVTVGIAGISNVAVISTAGLTINGIASTTGNIVSGNYLLTPFANVSNTLSVGSGSDTTISSAGIFTNTISATGNITANTFIGDGSQLANITTIENGNSFVTIPADAGNINMVRSGVNTVTISEGILTVAGSLGTEKIITSNVNIPNNVNSVLLGNTTILFGVNFFLPDDSTLVVLAS